MAASSQTGTSGTGKKMWLWGLGLAAVAVVALYTAGWFYATSVLKANVLQALGKQNAAGVSAECADMALRGFPFGMGLTCSKVSIDDHNNGASASFSNLDASARVYAPGDISWTLQSPAEIRTQGLTVSAEWSSLLSQLQTKGKGIEQGSTVIDGLKAGIVSTLAGQRVDLTATRTEIHARQNGADLDATIGIENVNVVIKDFPQPLPAVSASADVSLTGRAGLLAGTDETGQGLRGTSGIVRHIVADTGAGRTMKLSGPFSFDDQGFVSGQFKLELDQLGPWRDGLKQAIPAASRTIDFAAKLLKGLAAGGDSVSVDLAVDHGRVSLSGFIPLGQIPPI